MLLNDRCLPRKDTIDFVFVLCGVLVEDVSFKAPVTI